MDQMRIRKVWNKVTTKSSSRGYEFESQIHSKNCVVHWNEQKNKWNRSREWPAFLKEGKILATFWNFLKKGSAERKKVEKVYLAFLDVECAKQKFEILTEMIKKVLRDKCKHWSRWTVGLETAKREGHFCATFIDIWQFFSGHTGQDDKAKRCLCQWLYVFFSC